MVLPIENPCDFGNPEPCGVNPAFTYTRYPCDFDDPRPAQDTRGLPVIVDLQTPVKAEVVNRQREAVLAIEAELGIQPSGTFTTVRSRLDALEGFLCSIWNTIHNLGSPVDIKLNGTTIVSGVTSINFFGTGVNVTNAGNSQANIEITGGGGGSCSIDGYVPVHEGLSVLINGQTNFTLTETSWNNVATLFIGGIKQELSDYVINGNQLTWSGIPLLTTDIVEIVYYKIFSTECNGGGGGGSPLTIADEGVVKETNVTLIDFVGPGVSVVGDGSGGTTVTITGGGGNVIMHQEVFSAAPSQTNFVVSYTPANQESTELFIDGVSQTVGADYTVSGSTITYSGIPPLTGGEAVVVKYFENTGSGIGLPAVLAVDNQTGGYNIDFVNNTRGINCLNPVNPQDVATKAYVDGIFVSPNLANVLLSGNLTGGTNIDFGGASTGINLIDPINSQDAATKAYVDGYFSIWGLPNVLAINNSTNNTDIDFGGTSRGVNCLDPVNPQDVATKAYVDGYSGSGGGYLGIDVHVTSVADLPTPIAGVITLLANTAYGIDGLINIGVNIIEMSTGSKLVGGGGSSTKSEIRTANASPSPVIKMAAANTSIDGLIIQNTSTGPALTLASGASNFSVVDTTFISAGPATILVAGSGLGQITDSFVNVGAASSGILVNDDTTSLLVKNTKFKGAGSGSGNGINMDSYSGTKVVTQMVISNCHFEDIGYAFRQNNTININGSLSIVDCSAINLNTFIRAEIGFSTQASIISSNNIWNVGAFTVGLSPGGNQVFRGNISQGVAQTETPII